MVVFEFGSAFHYPGESASIVLMVPKSQLARIAGLNQALRGVLGIMAPPLGALLLELSGVQATLAVDIFTAIAAIGILVFVNIPQPKAEPIMYENSGFIKTILTDMYAGLRYLWQWKGAMTLVGLAMIFKIALSPAFSLIPLLVNPHFNDDATAFSFVEAASGFGVLLGGVILGVWGGFKRKIYSTLGGVITIGIYMLLNSFLPPNGFLYLVGIIFLIGTIIPITDGPINAILQSSVAPEFQGRVLH